MCILVQKVENNLNSDVYSTSTKSMENFKIFHFQQSESHSIYVHVQYIQCSLCQQCNKICENQQTMDGCTNFQKRELS